PQSLDMVSRRELAQALCSGCGAPPPVASLSLAYCSSLKVSLPSPSFLTRGLGGCGRGHPSLECLVLSHCSLVSDKGWAQAASFWLRLQHLSLSSCTYGLPAEHWIPLGRHCKQLQMLDVTVCPGISMAAIRCFQAQLPQVTCDLLQSCFLGGSDLILTL
uniref:Leucine rich repeat containing 29 n=1 Tax=Equus asinus asinus TaxID=83772 RepID=A0A8C4PN57_EQUAS